MWCQTVKLGKSAPLAVTNGCAVLHAQTLDTQGDGGEMSCCQHSCHLSTLRRVSFYNNPPGAASKRGQEFPSRAEADTGLTGGREMEWGWGGLLSLSWAWEEGGAKVLRDACNGESGPSCAVLAGRCTVSNE